MNDRIEKLLEHVRVNEKIERLAKESGCTIDRLGFGEGNLEKFAKLIILECASAVNSRDDSDTGFWANIIKEHFGVEE
jgi:hypothetical protein